VSLDRKERNPDALPLPLPITVYLTSCVTPRYWHRKSNSSLSEADAIVPEEVDQEQPLLGSSHPATIVWFTFWEFVPWLAVPVP
jgi:hypothetical protein